MDHAPFVRNLMMDEEEICQSHCLGLVLSVDGLVT